MTKKLVYALNIKLIETLLPFLKKKKKKKKDKIFRINII